MALSILILCIVSMTSFDPVISTDSAPLLDFGFSRLINDLASASNDSSNRQAMWAVFEEVRVQLHYFSGVKSLNGINGLTSGHSETLDHYYSSDQAIDRLYSSLERYLLADNVRRIKKIAKQCNSVETDSLRQMLFDFQDEGLFARKNIMQSLIEDMDAKRIFQDGSEKKTGDNCWLIKQSPQYEIYEIYHELVIMITKAYAMLFFAFNFLRDNGDDPLSVKRMIKDRKYEMTIRNFQKPAVLAMTTASRDIRSCELAAQQRGQEYIELKWLFNTIVTNEAYLNKDASCWETCDYYQNTTFYQYSPQPLDELNICHGRIYNCFQQTVDSYCPAKKGSRRFDGLLPAMMGKTSCTQKKKTSIKVENGWFDRCDQCLCYCDDYDRSDTVRKFSLRRVESDTSSNSVITGMQFVEKNGTIYLKIQEGKLGPNGTIEKSTVEWQPVNEIDYKSPFLFEEEFFTITYDKKSVNLDTLVVPTGRVLTGIGLHALGSRLALKIKSDAFNYSSGILQGGYWQSYAPFPREEITMTAPDNPAYMDQTVIDERKNTYVTFRMTDLEKDAGQTAIPFIDARPVVSNPPVPLSGAGIYYSGQTGYGGSIGLKAVTYDFAKVIGH